MNLRKVVLLLVVLCASCASYAQSKEAGRLVMRMDSVVDYNNPKMYNIKDIEITGIESMNVNLLLNSVGLHVGDSVAVPSDVISNAIKKLWKTKIFSDAKVYMQYEEDDLYLKINLKDRPFVSNWDIKGVSSSHKRDLLEQMKLTRNIQYSDYLVSTSKNIIKDFYAEKGFYNAVVTSNIIQDSFKFRDRTYVKVDFVVDKKSKVKIKEIIFEGLSGDIPENVIKRQMKNNKEKKLINMFKGAKFKAEKLKDDKADIVDYFQSKGYRNALVISDSVYVISEDRIGIKLKVYQGDKYYFRNISWIGNEKYTEEELNRLIRIKSGEVYDSKTLKVRLGLHPESYGNGTANVMSLYQDDGYLMFNLVPVEKEVAKDTVDVEIKMFEGEQYIVNSVTIRGNNDTNDRVYRRELFTRPGEIYSMQLVMESMQRVKSLGAGGGTEVVPNIEITPGSNNLTDVSFLLTEGSTDQFNFSGGYGAGSLVLGIGLTFNNVSLRKMFKKDAWKPYPKGDHQSLRLQVQTNGIYYKNISFSFLEPWLGGKKPNQFGVNFYYSDQTNGVVVFDPGNASFATLGVNVSYATRLSWPDPYFRFMFGVKYQNYNLDNWSNFIFKDGDSNIISLEAMLTRNSVNSYLYPTGGSEFTITASATPPYSLFRKDGYFADPNLTDKQRYKFVEYYKVDLKARWYQALDAGEKLVLYLGASFGYLGHYNPLAISPFEGFSVGGSGLGGYDLYGVTYVGLRGYADGSLTPFANNGSQARVYSKYTAELRYPIVANAGTTMFALIFAEAGNAADGWRAFNPFELKKSAGVGLRVFLPVLGMFGIDFGYGFDRLPGQTKASGFEIHFTMGQEF